jgi:hypothetical protein
LVKRLRVPQNQSGHIDENKKTLPLPLVDFRLWLHNVLGINVRNNKFIDKFRKNSEGGRKIYLGDLCKMDSSVSR